jgi:TonB family protein
MRMLALVVGICSVSAMGRAAVGQGGVVAPPSSTLAPEVLHKATAETVMLPPPMLQELVESEPDIAAPAGGPQAGMVSITFLVSKTGAVEEVAVAMGDGPLRKAAVDGVMGWKFRPYLVNGEPREYKSWMLIRFAGGVGVRMPAATSVAGVAGMSGIARGSANKSWQSGVASLGDPAPVSAGVVAGLLSQPVAPVYPPLAKAAHIQGVVVLHAILSKTGEVEKLEVVSGPPLLQQSALDAVRRWKYRPYLLNGEPVEVQTTINVNFTFAPPSKSEAAPGDAPADTK